MLGRIATLYYEYDFTHQQIADLMGWSRVKVTRALATARKQGIVKVTVLSDEPLFMDEEQGLRERFGLLTVRVGPPARYSKDYTNLVKVGAECVSEHVVRGMQVAVGLSETLAAVAQVIRPPEQPDTTFVPLQGTNPGLVTLPTPSNIAHEFSSAFKGSAYALAAPVIASSPEMLAVLQLDAEVVNAFQTARRSDIALVGVGGTTVNSSILLGGNMSEPDIEDLHSVGAVGDVNARFYDADGNPVETPRTALVLGLTLEEFKDIPLRIAVAAGAAKVKAIAGALRGDIINGLITDQPTARALLQT